MVKHKKELVLVISLLLVLVALVCIPEAFPRQEYYNASNAKVKITQIDNSGVYNTGSIKQGSQKAVVDILDGAFKGEKIGGVNILLGRLDLDKIYSEGDTALALLSTDDSGKLTQANLLDHYRLDKQLILILVFVVGLICFSNFYGLRTILSFLITMFSIWKIILPLMLKGYPPLAVALVMGITLTTVILLLIAGVGKRSFCAIISAVSTGVIVCLLSLVLTNAFKLNGTVMDWAEQLMYTGQFKINFMGVFQSAIYLGVMGALIDLSIDIAAALDEVYNNNPKITKAGMIKSGFIIGRSIVGSQITALLFAYMGSFITILMVFMAQGTPFVTIINSKLISAEILHTFIGFFGLLIVTPLTACVCGFVYDYRKAQSYS